MSKVRKGHQDMSWNLQSLYPVMPTCLPFLNSSSCLSESTFALTDNGNHARILLSQDVYQSVLHPTSPTYFTHIYTHTHTYTHKTHVHIYIYKIYTHIRNLHTDTHTQTPSVSQSLLALITLLLGYYNNFLSVLVVIILSCLQFTSTLSLWFKLLKMLFWLCGISCSTAFNSSPLSMGWKLLWIKALYSAAWIHDHILFLCIYLALNQSHARHCSWTQPEKFCIFDVKLHHASCPTISILSILESPAKSPLLCELLSNQLKLKGYSTVQFS